MCGFSFTDLNQYRHLNQMNQKMMIVLNKIENIPNLYDLFDVIAHLTILSEGMNMFEILVELFIFPVGKEPEQKLIHLAHRTFSIFIQYQS